MGEKKNEFKLGAHYSSRQKAAYYISLITPKTQKFKMNAL